MGSLVLAFTVGPRIWRIARERDLRTVGDFLEHRYGRAVRVAIAVLLWLGTLAILAGQLIAMSRILNVVAGVPKPVGCGVGGLIVIVYFTAGGLLTSAWVNLVQVILKLIGFGVALPLVLSRAGGLAGMAAATPGG